MQFQRRLPPIRRLTRAQLLTLTTWRWASVKVDQNVGPGTVLEQVALHATLGALRDVRDPFQLFARHAEAHPEYSLIRSLAVGEYEHDTLAHDILDAAFWLRWNELTHGAVGDGGDRHSPDPDAGSMFG